MGKGSNDRPESPASRPGSTRFTRRSLLRSAAAVASAAILPSGFARVACPGPGTPATETGFLQSQTPANNPSWYGFNLLEYFSTDPDWMKYFPYQNDGMFLESDFRWIRDWGFNFVRLPMDYRFWTDPQDLMKINEKKVEPIDRAIRLGGEVWSSRQRQPAPGAGFLYSRWPGSRRNRDSCYSGENELLQGSCRAGSLRLSMDLSCATLQGHFQ